MINERIYSYVFYAEEKTNTAVGPLHFMPLTQWKGDFSLIGEPASVQ